MYPFKTAAFFLLSLVSISIHAQKDSATTSPKMSSTMAIGGVTIGQTQVALIGNIADSNFTGTQIGTLFNAANGQLKGAQVAGVVNLVSDSMNGAQLAGACNVSRSINGIQLAGYANIAQGYTKGVMASGFANVTLKHAEVLQASGAFNYAGSMDGIQLAGTANFVPLTVRGGQFAGTMNYAGSMRGIQAAGWMNIVRNDIIGAQISGGINYAQKVKGAQIGILNFADSVDGVTIGLLSFVRHGYHKLEFSWTESLLANASFHTGSRFFHNILTVGIKPEGNDLYWSYGYGIGSAIRLRDRIDLCLDLVGSHVSKNQFNERVSELVRMDVLADFRIVKGLSLTVGPSLNVFVYDRLGNSSPEAVSGFVPYSSYDKTFDNRWKVNGWVGVRAGIRFF